MVAGAPGDESARVALAELVEAIRRAHRPAKPFIHVTAELRDVLARVAPDLPVYQPQGEGE